MSQHLTLDDYVFSFLKKNPISGSTYKSDGGWQLSDTIQNPRQVKTSRALDTWDIEVTGYKAEGEINADELRALQRKQVPVMATDGTGKSWGFWTIKTVSVKYEKIIEKGNSMVQRFSLSLMEYRQDENSSTI